MKNRKKNLLSEIAKKVIPYQWEKGDLDGYLRFDTNTPPYPPYGLNEFLGLMEKNCPVNEYGDPNYTRLKKLIADYEGVNPGMVSITNSGDEDIDVLGKTFLNPGDGFITTPPTYEMYDLQCVINKGINIEVPLTESDYSLDTDKVIATANKFNAKIIFLCNPNNPTGTTIGQKNIGKILKNTGSILVVDEVYREFYGQSSLSLLTRFKNLVILRSFSKFASLAGARIGYLLADPLYVQKFEAIRFPMGVSFLSYKLAEFVLEKGMKQADENIKIIISEREKMRSDLTALGLFVYPSKTNFLLAKFGKKSNNICRLLKEKKIIVRNRSNKKYLKGCVRITVRTPEENRILISTLKEII